MTSLRRRISFGVIGITSLVVLVAAFGIWMATRSVLLHGVDRELAQRLDRMRQRDATTTASVWRPRSTRQGSSAELRDRLESRRHVQVWTLDGSKELARSASLPEGDNLGFVVTIGIVQLTDGRRLRTKGIELKHVPNYLEPTIPNPSGPCVVIMGIDLGQVDDELTHMAAVLSVVWIVATILAASSVIMLSSAILKPVRRLSDAIDRLGPGDLAGRVPDTTGPDEVRGMVQRLNGLLDRLEQAFRREQATIASIAHELRTPVAALRAAIEFRLMSAPSVEESAVLRSNLQTVEHMQAMVSNLLFLARLESGKEPLVMEQVDLTNLIDDALESWHERARNRSRSLRADIANAVQVSGSILHLRLIVDNLIGNAVEHGDGDISVKLTVNERVIRLTIENSFPGILDTSQLGQSFYRADMARSGSDHSGLGLALCRRLAQLAGYRFELRTADHTFIAEIDLPIASR